MRTSPISSILDDLRSQISSGRLSDIPSVRTLAAQKNIAYPTAWRILDALKKEGLIANAPGIKARVAVPQSNTAHRLKNAPQILFETLRARIESGIYKSGNPLPKSLFLALSERVSTATVSAALRLCEIKKIAHRQNRSWIAGPAPALQRASRLSETNKPMVLLQTFSLNDWQDVFDAFQLSSFMTSVRNELSEFGMGMMPVVDPNVEPSMKPDRSRWTDPVKAAHMLGERYRGTIAIAIHPTDEYFGTYMAKLCSLKQPVVYFDHLHDCPGIGRGMWNINKRYHRFYFDHPAAVHIAIQSLNQHGHCRVGIYGSGMFDWTRNRVSLLKHAIGTINPAIQLIEVPALEDIWFDNPGEQIVASFFRRLNAKTEISTPGEQLRAVSSQFVKLIESGITALIALNDRMAWKYYFAIQALGLKIPQDISLISFDNEPASMFYPISTIDFGFSRLGYKAAHLFIGDIAISSGKTGELPATPYLMDRGSLDQARR